jgi:hypothetical protein
MGSRLAGRVTLAAKHGSPYLGMKRNLVMLSTVVAHDVKSSGRIVAAGRFFGPALRATLRRHHIALVKHLLFLFGKQEDLFTLHTRNFYIRHR